jgi:hypothetical protein
MLRMSEAGTTTSSEASRQLAGKRWGAQRPVKLAQELVARVDELPAAERARLRAALDEPAETRTARSDFTSRR